MGLKEDLKELIDELDRIHSGSFDWSKNYEFPDFVTTEGEIQRHFTKAARVALRRVATTMHANRPKENVKVEIGAYETVVRHVVAELHARDEFSEFGATGEKTIIKKLKILVDECLPTAEQEYTHYFPAWTLGMERRKPFKLGPITFFSRMDWLDAVDFSHGAKETYLGVPEANYRWKEMVRDALRLPKGITPLDGLAAPIYGAISTCPALLGVTIRGYEKNFSRKLARLACKAALDAISLAFGSPAFFHQQALQEERLPPVGIDSLMECNSHLWLPGTSLGKRIPHLTAQTVDQAMIDLEPLFPAFASILDALVHPMTHSYPKLSNRWATALDWFAEGNRESSDSIALTKIGTCLDVLANGGKTDGILVMVVNLTGASEDTIVIHGDNPLTLRGLIEDTYEYGRSQILHGNHVDRLKSFETERTQAAQLAKFVLIEAARRLVHYAGPDENTAFRTIKKNENRAES